MKWLETTVNTTHEAADIIAEIFFSMGCQGVSVADKNDIKDALKNNLYWDYVDPEVFQNSADCVKVASFFLEDEYAERAAELREKLEEVRKNFEACGGQDGEGCGSLEITARLVDDADWENNWKKYYKPIVVGGIQILPEWLLRERREGLLTVALDPGMAFGTGEHETTKMCLELMQSVPLKGKVLFDIGCGSGILGIAAAKLGAAEVFMTDIDPTSVLTAKKNAEKNGVLSAVRIERADLLSSDAEGNKSGVAEKNGVLSAVRIERADLLSGNAEEN
ncbi:MAG: 50S ribosomal protein L11 methyltransferase [Clostridiales bacterium]|jgi:ribosomal protein L11 methyltransferase|nr:50S ribosomal protein L11 methyltransferase [Clostridiales bacterium]